MRPAPRAQARLLPDGRRLHLQDGPIDLIVEAVGRDGGCCGRLSRGCVAVPFRAGRTVLGACGAALAIPRAGSGVPDAGRAADGERRRPPCGGNLHHADGGGRRQRRGRDPGRDARRGRGRAQAPLRQQRGRHRVLAWPGRDDDARPRRTGPIVPPCSRAPRSPRTTGSAALRLPARRGAAFRSASRTPSPFSHATPPRPTPPRPSSPTAWTFPAIRASRAPPPRSLQPDSDLGDRLVTRNVPPLDRESIAQRARQRPRRRPEPARARPHRRSRSASARRDARRGRGPIRACAAWLARDGRTREPRRCLRLRRPSGSRLRRSRERTA